MRTHSAPHLGPPLCSLFQSSDFQPGVLHAQSGRPSLRIALRRPAQRSVPSPHQTGTTSTRFRRIKANDQGALEQTTDTLSTPVWAMSIRLEATAGAKAYDGYFRATEFAFQDGAGQPVPVVSAQTSDWHSSWRDSADAPELFDTSASWGDGTAAHFYTWAQLNFGVCSEVKTLEYNQRSGTHRQSLWKWTYRPCAGGEACTAAFVGFGVSADGMFNCPTAGQVVDAAAYCAGTDCVNAAADQGVCCVAPACASHSAMADANLATARDACVGDVCCSSYGPMPCWDTSGLTSMDTREKSRCCCSAPRPQCAS